MNTIPEFLNTGCGLKHQLPIDGDGWDRDRLSASFGKLLIPSGAVKFLGDDLLPGQAIFKFRCYRFDHPGHVDAGNSVFALVKNLQVNFLQVLVLVWCRDISVLFSGFAGLGIIQPVMILQNFFDGCFQFELGWNRVENKFTVHK